MPPLSVTNTHVPNTLAEAGDVNQNFSDIVTWANANAIQKDASLAFTAVPSGPATNPVSSNQFTRKAYVDIPRYLAQNVTTTSATIFAGGQVTWANMPGSLTATNSHRVTTTASGFTVTDTGLYMIGAQIQFITLGGSHLGVGLRVNGVVGDADIRAGGAFYLGAAPVVRLLSFQALTAGATVGVSYDQDAGSGINSGFSLWAMGVPGTFA